tara:strand:- start:100 stop:771 length:672 start_codon:yes stop_codon:yes gene_type:complete
MISRTIRSLDGIALAILAFTFLIAFPGAGQDNLGRFNYVMTLPFIAIAIFSFRLPKVISGGIAYIPWMKTVMRLRLSALTAVGLAPFFVWWSSAPRSFYIGICTVGFFFALILVVYNVNDLAQLIVEAHARETLRSVSHTLRYIILFFTNGVVGALTVCFFIAMPLMNSTTAYHAIQNYIYSFQGILVITILLIPLIIGGAVIPILAATSFEKEQTARQKGTP